MIQQVLDERLVQGKGMEVSFDSNQTNQTTLIHFNTNQTLAPNYNESIQIDDFLYGLETMGEF